jgi:membrane protein insertase Oxa1/YidC/SpoIIIJ
MQDSKSYLKLNAILHLALMAGQVLLAAVFIALTGKTEIILNPDGDIFFILVPAVALIGIFASGFMFKKFLEQANAKATLQEKLNTYRPALIVRFALLEGPSLFGLVAYFLTGNLFYVFVSAFIIIYFFTLRPTKEKLENDLQLDYKLKEEFEKGTRNGFNEK